MTMLPSASRPAARRGPGAATPSAPGRRSARTPATPIALDTARLDANRIDAAMVGFVTYVVSVATGVEARCIFATTRHSAPAARAGLVAM